MYQVASQVLKPCTIQPNTITRVDESYRCIKQALGHKDYYYKMCLNDFAPTDHYQQWQWFDKIELLFKTVIDRYPYGNNLELWFI